MCGLAGGIHPNISTFLRDALLRLEYRGYDSWGLILADEYGKTSLSKGVGVPTRSVLPNHKTPFLTGLAHTRWATQGEVCERNAHPIRGGLPGSTDEVYVVHNGVIDNYKELRSGLECAGYVFVTDTDTEVIAHSLAWTFTNWRQGYFREVLGDVLTRLWGRFSFAAISSRFPEFLFLFCNGSPLVVCPEAGLFASDSEIFQGYLPARHTLVRMGAGEVGYLCRDGDNLDFSYSANPFSTFSIVTNPFLEETSVNEDDDHPPETKQSGQLMRQEIAEQPGLVLCPRPEVPGLPEGCETVWLFGCGSSYYAALLARNWFEEIAYVTARVRLAAEDYIFL